MHSLQYRALGSIIHHAVCFWFCCRCFLSSPIKLILSSFDLNACKYKSVYKSIIKILRPCQTSLELFPNSVSSRLCQLSTAFCVFLSWHSHPAPPPAAFIFITFLWVLLHSYGWKVYFRRFFKQQHKIFKGTYQWNIKYMSFHFVSNYNI